jgi:hypothetical protein
MALLATANSVSVNSVMYDENTSGSTTCAHVACGQRVVSAERQRRRRDSDVTLTLDAAPGFSRVLPPPCNILVLIKKEAGNRPIKAFCFRVPATPFPPPLRSRHDGGRS